VNEGYIRDEVLLDLDRIGADVKPGALMSIAVVKPEPSRNFSGYGGSSGKQVLDPNGAGKEAGASDGEWEGLGERYIFVAKDMPKDMKSRNMDAQISVVRHIADAFGIKRGSQVVLAPVSLIKSRCAPDRGILLLTSNL
jgi:hypothetical protein